MKILGLVGSRVGYSRNGRSRIGRSRNGRSRINTSTVIIRFNVLYTFRISSP